MNKLSASMFLLVAVLAITACIPPDISIPPPVEKEPPVQPTPTNQTIDFGIDSVFGEGDGSIVAPPLPGQ